MSRPRNLSLLALVTLLSGCSLGTYSPKEVDEKFPLAHWTSGSPRGIRRALAALEKEVGRGYRLKSLSISQHAFTAEVQPAGRTGELDRVSLWKGSLHNRSPVTTSGSDLATLESQLFAPDATTFARIPGMILASLKHAGFPQARPTGVTFERRWQDRQLQIQVRVTNDRRNATVRWDPGGALIAVDQH
jgi:hypothetical protein